jgi:hypothetical protein
MQSNSELRKELVDSLPESTKIKIFLSSLATLLC